MPTDKIDEAIESALADAPEESPKVEEYPVQTSEREGYAWASDVFWVYDHLGDRVSRERAPNSGCYATWKWAKKNLDDFIGQMLPKAMNLLERARDKSSDEDIIQDEEKRAIAEMQRLLKRAVAEAAGAADE